MPKLFNIHDKEEWLQAYKAGHTEKQIASKYKCDARTVRKGIAEAQRNREVLEARTYLLRDALSKHQQDLLNTLNEIYQSLTVPEFGLPLPDEYNSIPFPLPLDKARWEDITDASTKLNEYRVHLLAEDTLLWKLLYQHLKRDQLWVNLNHFKSSLNDQLKARIGFKQRLFEQIKSKTGCEIISTPENSKVKYFVSYPVVMAIYYLVGLRRLCGKDDKTNPEENLTFADGVIRHNMTPVVWVNPQKTKDPISALTNAFKAALVSEEAELVSRTHEELVSTIDKTKAITEVLKLMNLLPGHCVVCKRIGT
jgi:hypothetical protein